MNAPISSIISVREFNNLLSPVFSPTLMEKFNQMLEEVYKAGQVSVEPDIDSEVLGRIERITEEMNHLKESIYRSNPKEAEDASETILEKKQKRNKEVVEWLKTQPHIRKVQVRIRKTAAGGVKTYFTLDTTPGFISSRFVFLDLLRDKFLPKAVITSFSSAKTTIAEY